MLSLDRWACLALASRINRRAVGDSLACTCAAHSVGAGKCARQRTYFLCFAKESKQRKATPLSVTHSCAVGNLLLPMSGGGRANSLRSNKHGPFSACHWQKQARPKGMGLACAIQVDPQVTGSASLGIGLGSMKKFALKNWRKFTHTAFNLCVEAKGRA